MNLRSRETRDQRLRRYLKRVAEARDLAAQSKPLETKETCLSMAESWLALAMDDEAQASKRRGAARHDNTGASRPLPSDRDPPDVSHLSK